MDILQKIQGELNAPKSLFNKFGNYKYRSCETILEALKPLLAKHECSLIVSDEIVTVGNRVYVKASAYLKKDGLVIGESSSFAREPETKKGMDEAQITGATSSYARKYALNGLFAIDDNKDPDTDEHHQEAEIKQESNVEQQQPAARESIFNVLNMLPLDIKEGYVARLKSKELPANEETLQKICRENNIKC